MMLMMVVNIDEYCRISITLDNKETWGIRLRPCNQDKLDRFEDLFRASQLLSGRSVEEGGTELVENLRKYAYEEIFQAYCFSTICQELFRILGVAREEIEAQGKIDFKALTGRIYLQTKISQRMLWEGVMKDIEFGTILRAF